MDNAVSLVADIKDDLKNDFEESLGIGSYSNIKSMINTYLSIFERNYTKATIGLEHNKY